MDQAAVEDSRGRAAVLLASVQKAKRQAVVGACERCRSKKIKCDGERPCSTCKKKSIQCIFEVEENESHQEARKRKFEEISQAYSEAQDLLAAMANSDERTARELFNGIRKGQTAASIMRDCQTYSQQQSAGLGNQQRKKLFIMAVVQSTLALREVIGVGISILEGSSHILLPQQDAYESIRDTVIHLESIGQLLRDANPHATLLLLGGLPEYNLCRVPRAIGDGLDHGPVVWVETAPWVDLSIGNHATSHLISIFLRIHNPFWRCVEEDLFVKAMRSGQLDSGFCSPLLVNAILALASQHSEIDEAFFTPGELLTRGEHFHREALRLWALEEGLASLTNIQALLLLSIESGVRGNDKLGNQLVEKAYTLHKMLPIPDIDHNAGSAARDYCRARRVIAWTSVYLE
ncbi:hypothetical protein DOTSEDRAFT_71176 [Dothistroma septosporum NZE10]|uniref:Zn(2)-C6 fungal-type domain-containing protein n=1 Tax=Dothistroma septosporum (strain NZE10 / CBS 128990) TaxID=675120 RepID=N1PSL0_DOTSN|nr:hypothetical protein DOTSEDRAFT_71176 [Dothistroma septosporum NZE10]